MKRLVLGAVAAGVICCAIDSQAAFPLLLTPNASIVLASGGTITVVASQISSGSEANIPGLGAQYSYRVRPLTITTPLPSSTQYVVQFASDGSSTLSAATLATYFGGNGSTASGGITRTASVLATFHRPPGGADWKSWRGASGVPKSLSLQFNGRTINAPRCYPTAYSLALTADGVADETITVSCMDPAGATTVATLTGAGGLEVGFAAVGSDLLTTQSSVTSATWTVGGLACTGGPGYVSQFLLDNGTEQLTLSLSTLN